MSNAEPTDGGRERAEELYRDGQDAFDLARNEWTSGIMARTMTRRTLNTGIRRLEQAAVLGSLNAMRALRDYYESGIEKSIEKNGKTQGRVILSPDPAKAILWRDLLEHASAELMEDTLRREQEELTHQTRWAEFPDDESRRQFLAGAEKLALGRYKAADKCFAKVEGRVPYAQCARGMLTGLIECSTLYEGERYQIANSTPKGFFRRAIDAGCVEASAMLRESEKPEAERDQAMIDLWVGRIVRLVGAKPSAYGARADIEYYYSCSKVENWSWSSDYKKGLRYAAQTGMPGAMAAYGFCYCSGEEKEEWLRRAAVAGHALAKEVLDRNSLNTQDIWDRWKDDLLRESRAYESSISADAFDESLLLIENDPTPSALPRISVVERREPQPTAEAYPTGAEQAPADSLKRSKTAAAAAYEYQRGMEALGDEDYARARGKLWSSAVLGSTKAMEELACMMSSGLGGERDLKRAHSHFVNAALIDRDFEYTAAVEISHRDCKMSENEMICVSLVRNVMRKIRKWGTNPAVDYAAASLSYITAAWELCDNDAYRDTGEMQFFLALCLLKNNDKRFSDWLDEATSRGYSAEHGLGDVLSREVKLYFGRL